jgi:hypothetical protein
MQAERRCRLRPAENFGETVYLTPKARRNISESLLSFWPPPPGKIFLDLVPDRLRVAEGARHDAKRAT